MLTFFIMRKSHFKKAILSLKTLINEHHEKIKLELNKDYPDQGLIKHWQKEIRAFQKGIQQVQKRLGKN